MSRGKIRRKKTRLLALNQDPPLLPVRRVRALQSRSPAGSILYALAQSYGGIRHFHADQPPQALLMGQRATDAPNPAARKRLRMEGRKESRFLSRHISLQLYLHVETFQSIKFI